MFKTTIAVCLLALSGAALADGVPLITAGPPLAANDAARKLPDTKQPGFVKLHPIALNKAAFGANVLTVVVDGKTYRFVGSMMPAHPPLPKEVTEKQPNTMAWSGKEPSGGFLVLTKNVDDGSMLGGMQLPPARRFNITTPRGGSVVLVEMDANVTPTMNMIPDGPWDAQWAASPASASTAPQRAASGSLK